MKISLGSANRRALSVTVGVTLCLTASAGAAFAAPFSFLGRRAEAAPQAAAQLGADWDRTIGRQRLGAPYQADGVWYVPANQPNYYATGVATPSHRPEHQATASGEAFADTGLTGAHATLPLPSMVEVANLQTGRKALIRLNDRGATKPGQVIELSARAAEALGVPETGAQVRVRYMGPAPVDKKAYSPGQIAAAAPVVRLVRSESPIRTAAAPVPHIETANPGELPPGYGIQAGAFASKDNAERAAIRLVAAGPARIHPLDRNGQRLYRVVVGQWTDQASATTQLRMVQTLGFEGARVVQF